MRRRAERRTARALAGAVLGMTLAATLPGPLRAQPEPAGAPVTLALEVSVNGWPRGLVAEFRQAGGRLSLRAEQFRGLGFQPSAGPVTLVEGEPRVFLDQVPGLTWQVDMAAQTIDLRAPVEALVPAELSVSPPPAKVESRADWGGFLSYDAFGEWSARDKDEVFTRSGSVNLEARLFAPGFTLGGTGFVVTGPVGGGWVRLDTALTVDRPGPATSVVVGDAYSGALDWTRSLRFGGVQYRRDFGLRPDLVTQPMPQFSTGVTAPSSLDLFVNGVERFAAGAAPGGLRLRDLPVTTGANQVRIVLTDPAGRRREVLLPFYVSTELLAPGFTDFSFEAGAERLDYAVKSNRYGDAFVSGSIRRGFTASLTGEAHGEAAGDFVMGGVGARAALFEAVVVSGVVAASHSPQAEGMLWSLGFERTGPRASAAVRYEESTPGFEDLAARFGQPHLRRSVIASGSWQMSPRQSATLTYVLQERGDGFRSEVVTGGLSRSLFHNRLRADINGYADLSAKGAWGASFMLSFPLGGRAMASASVEPSSDRTAYVLTANGDGRDPRFSWSGRYARDPATDANLDLTWEGYRLDAHLGLTKVGESKAVRAELGQSLVLIDGGVFVASRIDDAFTVVDLAGLPGVEVFLENRGVGRTGRSGRLLVNRLQGGEANDISIAPLDLPLAAQAETFAKTVAPRRGSGVVTRFAIDRQFAAVVILTDRAGKPLPMGAEVRLAGAEPAVLGYGGEAYLRGVQPGENALQVIWPEGGCRATFRLPEDAAGLPRVAATPCV